MQKIHDFEGPKVQLKSMGTKIAKLRKLGTKIAKNKIGGPKSPNCESWGTKSAIKPKKY